MKINQIITMFSALVVLSGCAKQEIDFETVDSIRYKVRCSNIAPDVQVKSSTLSFNGSDIPLFFSQVQDINLASVSETVSADTRATLINNNDNGDRSPIAAEDGISTFIASAYSATSAVYEEEAVNWNGTAWKTGTNYRWPENASLKFYSFANLPQNGTEVNITSDGISMSHTVQTAAAEQKDILLGYYEGTGNPEGTADIDFDHPLTAVIIKAGQIDGMKAITSVKVSGLISEGTFTMQKSVDDGDSSWEVPEAETYTTIITQSNTGGLPIDEEDRMIGEPLVLIPQNLEAHPVKLEVKLKIASYTAGTTTKEVTVTADLNEGEWEQGCTNIYTVGYDAYAYDFSLKTASDANTTFYGSESAETKTISLNSNKYLTTTAIQQSWVIKSYQIGNSAPVEVGGNTFEEGGLTVTNTSSSTAAQLKIEAAARSNRINRGNHDYWVGDNGAWSPSEWNDKGFIDLSRMDFSKDAYASAVGAHDMTTANCYIIRHAGKYKLPLIYGNGVVNGIENTKSYYPNLTTSATNVLKRFANHNHTGDMDEGNITSAFIENNEGCGGENLKCAVVWQDQGVVLTNLTLDAYSEVGGSYNTGNVRYLNFEVPQSSICQNNAIVCIYFDVDSDGEYDEGEAVWSWHIWVTNDPALLDNPIEVLSPGGVNMTFCRLTSLVRF